MEPIPEERQVGTAMSDVNVAAISGRVTRDAEVAAAGATMAAKFSVAVADYKKGAVNAAGEVTNEYTNFVDCTLFGDRAERLAPYITKGRQVFVRGRLHWSSWEKDGQRRSKLDVTVDDIVFGAQPKGDGGEAVQRPAYQAPQNAQQAQAQAQAYGEVYDEEIPF